MLCLFLFPYCLTNKIVEESLEQAEDAVEHMCFLTDANRLYDNALGLYDLELTLLVAQQAQRVRVPARDMYLIKYSNEVQDPREYLPFLRKLQQLPELRRYFEIDNYLGRWTKALGHLHGLGVHDELREYVAKHALYKDAIDIYKYEPENLRDITHLYANHLQEESKYKDAGIGMPSPTPPRLYPSTKKTNKIKSQPTNPSHSTQTPISATNLPTSGANLFTPQCSSRSHHLI